MPMKTKIGTEVVHVTRESDTTFMVKRSKVNLQRREHIVAASRKLVLVCLVLAMFCFIDLHLVPVPDVEHRLC